MSELSNSNNILDEAPIGYVKTDESFRIMDANRTFANLLGVEKNSLFNLPLSFFVTQSHRASFSQYIDDLTNSLTVQLFTTQLQSPSGHSFWIQVKCSLVETFDTSHFHFYFTDMTEKVMLEDALRERIKELTCLYNMSTLYDIPETHKGERLERAVALIPPAWQYPEITAARVLIHDKIIQTPNFKESQWRLLRPVQVNKAIVGQVEVVYLQQSWSDNDSPFLPEEEDLISAIASELGRMIERMWAQEIQQESDRLLRLAQVVARVGYYSLDIAKGSWKSSPVLNSLLGIDDSVEKNIDTWLNIVLPDC
jgi:PAS domain S-box-containing protein